MSRVNRSGGKIVAAFVTLVRKEGYQGVSVADIVREAGVSRITFYRNFSSREDVMAQFIEGVSGEAREAVRQKLQEHSLRSYVELIFASVLPYSDVIRELYAANVGELILNAFNRYFLETPMDWEGFRTGAYERSFLIGAIYNVMLEWIRGGGQETPAEMAVIFSHMINEKEIIYA